MRHATMTILIGTAAWLGVVAPAGAATVSRDGGAEQIVTFQAAPGETNIVTVRFAFRNVVIEDAGGAAITTTARGCVANGSVVVCAGAKLRPSLFPYQISIVRVWTDDGNDQVTFHGGVNVLSQFRGGPGDDVFTGGDGPASASGEEGDDTLNGGNTRRSHLQGGPGNDLLNGGGRYDQLWGEEGDDVLNGGAGADDMEGGPGADVFHGGTGEVATTTPGLGAGDSLGTPSSTP